MIPCGCSRPFEWVFAGMLTCILFPFGAGAGVTCQLSCAAIDLAVVQLIAFPTYNLFFCTNNTASAPAPIDDSVQSTRTWEARTFALYCFVLYFSKTAAGRSARRSSAHEECATGKAVLAMVEYIVTLLPWGENWLASMYESCPRITRRNLSLSG